MEKSDILALKFSAVHMGFDAPAWETDKQHKNCRHHYKCTFHNPANGKSYTIDFWNNVKNSPVTMLGVLECVALDATSAIGTFENFCGELGYDTDSRKAERMHKACVRERVNLCRLFGCEPDDLYKVSEMVQELSETEAAQ
ncbi:MAG: hypothetical protein KGJ13_02050 [Patescibacteria group bacterium]|nr:hypothetical protein [Patescibacteria group bacterium]